MVALVMALVNPGCGSDAPSEPSATVASVPEQSSTTPPETTTTTEPSVEQQVEEAYVAAMNALFEAGAAGKSDLPSLVNSHQGPSLELAQDLVEGLQADGQILWLQDGRPPETQVTAVEIVGAARAEVVACTIDNTQRRRASDGFVVDSDVVSRQSSAVMRLVGGTWKLESQADLGTWNDADGCSR